MARPVHDLARDHQQWSRSCRVPGEASESESQTASQPRDRAWGRGMTQLPEGPQAITGTYEELLCPVCIMHNLGE